MFIQNKYNNWYHQIIQRASNRFLEGYAEKHHIIPRSLGGSDDIENLVILTAREHFICHLLLTKMVSGQHQYKMIKAAKMLANASGPGQSRYTITNRVYAMLKENVEVPLQTRIKMSNSQKRRFSNTTGTFLNRKHSEETRKKMSISASKSKSTAWKESASKNRKGRPAPNKGISHSIETKKKISDSVSGEKNGFFGKQHSQEQREKKRQEKLASPKKICYYCNKEIDPMNYSRWHGDKCKMRKI